MIHRLTVLDRENSIGITLYDNHQLYVQSDLLIGMVQALMMLGQEMGPVKGALREAELGQYQISILSRDKLAYVAIQDTYDSEPFTNQILTKVINRYHDELLGTDFHTDLKNGKKIREAVASMLQTMKFPEDKLDAVSNAIQHFNVQIDFLADTLFLADLDDGIVSIFNQKEGDDTILRLLMEILSEIPFERHWIGQSKLLNPKMVSGHEMENELWLIYRIGDTDFCILGRSYYNTISQRETLVLELETLTETISDIIFND